MPATFRNPLLTPEGPDPWLMFHDGFYYFSVTTGDYLALRRAASILDLPQTAETVVWRDETLNRCMHMWAPEWYLVDGHWYCYYSASGEDFMAHRCFVLESESDDPIGPYRFKTQLMTDGSDAFYAIDGSILALPDGRRHFFYASFPDHRLFIADMENPWTLKGQRIYLEADGFGCEEVREGPVVLRRNEQIFLIYSICDTAKPDYKLGMLVADENSDLLDPASWRQYPEPVFTRCDENGVYGPGHNCFFKSPDGTQDWICYHAKASAEFTTECRTPRVQPFQWRPDGLPDFGVPLSLETDIELPSGDPGYYRSAPVETAT